MGAIEPSEKKLINKKTMKKTRLLPQRQGFRKLYVNSKNPWTLLWILYIAVFWVGSPVSTSDDFFDPG